MPQSIFFINIYLCCCARLSKLQISAAIYRTAAAKARAYKTSYAHYGAIALRRNRNLLLYPAHTVNGSIIIHGEVSTPITAAATLHSSGSLTLRLSRTKRQTAAITTTPARYAVSGMRNT